MAFEEKLVSGFFSQRENDFDEMNFLLLGEKKMKRTFHEMCFFR